MVYTFFDKKTTSLTNKSASGGAIKSISNQQLANKIHKRIIRNF